MYSEFKKEQIIEVDIHGYKANDAQYYLEKLLVGIDNNIREIVVIHGYRSGSSLRDMVRVGLRSKRIKQRIISLNPGVTSLILK